MLRVIKQQEIIWYSSNANYDIIMTLLHQNMVLTADHVIISVIPASLLSSDMYPEQKPNKDLHQGRPVITVRLRKSYLVSIKLRERLSI